MSKEDTLVFYLLIIILSFLFASLSQRIITVYDNGNINRRIRFVKGWFFLAYITIFIVTVFTEVGVDFIPYVTGYGRASYERIFISSSEPGFVLFECLLKIIVKDPYAGVKVIKGITLTIIFYVIYAFRYKIHLGTAILGYMALAFFDSMNLISLHVAAAFFLLGCLRISEEKKIQGFILFLVSGFLHYSAFVPSVVLFIYIFVKSRGEMSKWRYALIIVGGLCIGLNAGAVGAYIFEMSTFLSKYAIYGMNSREGSGLMIFFNLLPVAYFLFQIFRTKQYEDFVVFCSVMMIVSLVIGMGSYVFEMMSRCKVYSWVLYLVFLPYAVRYSMLSEFEKSKYAIINLLNHRYVTTFLIVTYFIFRLWFLISLGNIEAAGVDSYEFSF